MNSARMLGLFLLVTICSPAFASDVLVSRLVDAPDPSIRGGEITYSIDVENQRADEAENVVMTFPVPPTTTFVSVDNASCSHSAGVVTCNYGDMIGTAAIPPGPTETANIVIRSTAATGATVHVEATVTTDSTEENSDNNHLTQNTTLDDGADLATVFTSASPNPVIGGGTVTYTNAISNHGPNDASSVQVIFQLSAYVSYVNGSATGSGWSCSYSSGPHQITCSRSNLAADTTAPVITWKARVTEAWLGTLSAAAVVTSDIGDWNPGNNNHDIDVEVVYGTDLSIGATVSASEVVFGNSVTLSLQPRNLGPFDANDAVVVATIPDGFIIGTPTGNGWSCEVSGQVVTCTRSLYAVGATDDISIPLTAPDVDAVNDYEFVATIATNPGEESPDRLANNSTNRGIRVTPDGVDLDVVKTKSPDLVPQPLGGYSSPTATSTITVTNNGPRDAAAGTISVADVLSPWETFTDASGSNWSCSYNGPSHTVNCDYTAILAADASSATLTILTTPTAESEDKQLENTATVSYSGDPGDFDDGNNEASASVSSTIARANLNLSKAADAGNLDSDTTTLNADPSNPATFEDTIVYTLIVTNDGPDAAGGIVVTDPIAGWVSGGTGVSFGGSSNYDCATSTGGTVTCTQKAGITLAAGSSDSIIINLTRPLQDGLQTNTATAFSNQVGDDDRDDNDASASVTVEAVADIELRDKRLENADGNEVKSGVDATYRLRVRNLGPSTAHNVTLVDAFTLPADDTGFTFISWSANGGGNCSGLTAGTSYTAADSPVLNCTWSSIDSGVTRRVFLTLRPNYDPSPASPRNFINDASVSTDTFDGDHDNDNAESFTLTVVQDNIDLLINNSDIPDPVAWDPASGGDNDSNDVIYHVAFTNRGPSYATGVQFVYTMTPKDGKTVRFDCDEAAQADACATTADNCSVTGGSNPVTGPDTLTLTCLANTVSGKTNEMAAGDSGNRYLHFRFLTEPASTGDTHSTNAVISANENETILANNEELENTSVRAKVDLEILGKSADEAGVQLDQPFVWTISVTNNGPLASPATELTDTLPTGMSLHGAPPSWVNVDDGTDGLCVIDEQDLSCDLGAMSVGANAVISVPVTIDVYELATVENCAVAITSGIDPEPANNESICGSVNVSNSYYPSDFGDAPDTGPGTSTDNYETLLDTGGPRHMEPGGTWLGACVDADGDGSQQDIAARADDDNDGPVQAGECDGDDEDGVTIPAVLIAGRESQLGFEISGETCALDAWIDFNRDGDFDDDDEQVFLAESLAPGPTTLTVLPPADLTVGFSYARFRCSAEGGLGPVGEVVGGEVEDYRVSLYPDTETTAVDLGDAPDSGIGTTGGDYRTVALDNGAAHVLGGENAPYLGQCVDSDPATHQGVFAVADDLGAAGGPGMTVNICTNDDDEDGVTFTTLLRQGVTAPAIEVVSSADTEACLLNAWIDFNKDGDFTDSGEQIAADVSIASATTETLSPAVPADAAIGMTYARFRCSTVNGLTPSGAAPDGEVEDYLVAINPDIAETAADFGDAPDSGAGHAENNYATTEIDSGPSHVLIPGASPFLGSCVDSDAGTVEGVSASGDDDTPEAGPAVVLGSCADAGDDEDGVALPDILYVGTTPTIEVTTAPVAACIMNGWIDFDRNGDFTDPGEQVLVNQPQAAGTTEAYLIGVPTGLPEGPVYARFRCSSIELLGPDGPAPDGEVEDYVSEIRQTAVWFNVQKVFTDGHQEPVEVAIQCNDGNPNHDSLTLMMTPGFGDVGTFVISNFNSGWMDCSITESSLQGYTASYDNSLGAPSDSACEFLDVVGGHQYDCLITNTPDPVEVRVFKEWLVTGSENLEVPQITDIRITCTSEILEPEEDPGHEYWIGPTEAGFTYVAYNVAGNAEITVDVVPVYPQAQCWAAENVQTSGVEMVSDCGSVEAPGMQISTGNGDSCLMTNTVFYEAIPALDRAGLVLLALLMLSMGMVVVRRSF